jgi:lipoate-protein ligase B
VQFRLYDLGLIDYQAAYTLQTRLAEKIAGGEHPAALLLLQHPHVYTFGRQGNPENLLWDQIQLADRGIAVEWTDRGGDVTYHGPGQLVGYPLLLLSGGVLNYLRKLEEVLIQTLAGFGIPATRVEGQTGVWVSEGEDALPSKIASIGVRVDAHGITRHGFALNIATDMDYWGGIIACGLENQKKTSIHTLRADAPGLPAVQARLGDHFAEVFGADIQNSSAAEILDLLD